MVLLHDLADAIYSLLNLRLKGLDITLAEERSYGIPSLLVKVMIERKPGGIV